ncbi:MAG: aspartate kinase [Promethearchaeota archaeon]
MKISVFKFGGSCLKDKDSFKKIADIIDLHKDEKMVFVASALSGITDKLIKIAYNADKGQETSSLIKKIKEQHTDIINSIFKEDELLRDDANRFISTCLADIRDIISEIQEFGIEKYFLDYIMSYGEKMSTYILYLFVESLGIPSEYHIGEELIITDTNFGNALPKWDLTCNRVKNELVPIIKDPKNKTIFCVTGFIGRNKIGYTTTLGRGGSDFTATILARCLYDLIKGSEIRVVLWKDVPGIFSTHPKYTSSPTFITHLSYDEAKEMAFYGAKILHPKCLFGLDIRKIPVEIRSFDNPQSENYSIISEKASPFEVTGISTIENVSLLTVASGSLVSTPGVLARIFSIMGNNEINVSLVAQSSSEVNTSFIVEEADGKKAYELIKSDSFFKGWAEVELQDVSIIAITGKGISKSGIQAKIFSALAKENIKTIALSQSSDGLNLSIVLNKEDISKAVSILNDYLKNL